MCKVNKVVKGKEDVNACNWEGQSVEACLDKERERESTSHNLINLILPVVLYPVYLIDLITQYD